MNKMRGKLLLTFANHVQASTSLDVITCHKVHLTEQAHIMRVDTHTESGAENSISILTDYFKTVSSPFFLEEMKNY